MKIASVSSAILTPSVSVAGWALVTGRIAQLPCVLVKVETDDGHSGIGIVGALQPFDAPAGAIRECIAYLGSALIGKPLRIDALMAEMARLLFGFADIRAAFEAAFLEIVAASRSTGIADILGGIRHHRLPVSRMVSLQSPELMTDAAAKLAADGYKVIKFKLGGDVDLDVARARAVRSAVGPAMRLTADANGRYDAKTAIRAIERIDEFNLDIIEQPVPRDDLDGLRMVTHAVRPQVEADESAGSPAEIARLGRDRVVDSVVLRLPRLGGVRPILESVAICRSFGLRYRFGVCFLPGHFQAFAAQVASVLPEIPLAHELAEHTLLDGDPFLAPEIRDGYLHVPDAFGARLKPGETISWTPAAP
ncbi:hypothetical protein DWF00_26620 [Bosea caraganae]|uniref:Mandelate racemase/muconate lactonizing enzyme C-terminal domain-containing protein n=1 Tax=Bosea caraganae TaxID=2763117 RepID=A0A370LA66_9HYPH|nr:enolase C-terminal domain-like protein [Bosea caraganae]RDJ21908.1 hypothetical protein DWF00_26620 [Bosea caraganae]RDJ28060.1 hypothetical protein DWE98_05535 [Bosea caraganae]